jgi:hypothetical protein
MKRYGIIAACALLAACGGSSGTRSNAAAGRTFSYGAPTTATSTETAALDVQVSGASALGGPLDASSAGTATGMADFSGATDALLGSSPVARMALPSSVSAPMPRLALSIASASVLPACVTVTASGTATTVTLAHCVETSSYTDTNNVTTTTTVTLDGTVHSAAPGSLDWDLQAQVSMTSPSLSLSGSSHQHGDLAVTSSTVKGSMLNETAITVAASGSSFSAAVDESLTVDVTYTAGPPECVTGGTLEAKRVWVQRPQGATAAQLPDQGAKITWTGCGVAQIAFSQ